MPVIGQFGKLSSTVVPLKGTPANKPSGDVTVPVGGPHLAFTTSNADPTKTWWLNGLDVTCPTAAWVVLKRGATVLWSGRLGWDSGSISPRWHDAEFPVAPGETLTVELAHFESQAMDVSVNVMGFLR